MDKISKSKRSWNMSQIKSTDTKPELLVRKFLHSRGYRFRNNYKKLPGKPDVVLPKYKTAIFIDGCYWHRHKDCKHSTTPKSNTRFWTEKFQKNIDRDNAVNREFENLNWRLIRRWECEISDESLEGLIEILKDS